nr:hypothetical protein [uncultured Brevundimonas sp.]
MPIGETIRIAYASVFGQIGLVAKTAFLPFLISAVLVVPSFAARDSFALVVIVSLLRLVPYTLFGVTWHRLILLGAQIAPPVVFPGWQRRHWRFYGFALAITAVTTLLVAVVAQTSVGLAGGADPESAGIPPGVLLTILIALLAALYFMLRLSFVFPAVAVEEPYGLADAWRHTKGQGLRLMLLMFLTLSPVMLFGWMLIALLIAPFTGPPGTGSVGASGGLLAYTLGTALGYLSLALSLSVISSAFRICTGWIPGAPPSVSGPSGGDTPFQEGP